MEKPKEFRLTQFNQTTSGLVTIKWAEQDGGAGVEKRKLPLHKDFQKHLTKMESYVAEYYNINEDRVSIKSIAIVHYEEDKGESVQITASYTHPDSEQVTTIKTSKMQVHNDFYGFEGNLKKTLKALSSEASKYVFDLKSSQVAMEIDEAA